MQRTRQQIMSSLGKKGFTETDSYRDHYYFMYYTQSGKKTRIITKLSRGTHYKSIGNSLLNMMAKECKLNKNDFMDLIDCPLSRADYEKKLIGKECVLYE